MFSPDLDKEISVLQKLIRYFYNGSLNVSLQPEEVESFTWNEQFKFLKATVYNQTVAKYPVSSEFNRLFFKKIISILEPVQEVHDDFYTFLCTVIKENMQRDFCYRHYVIGNNLENMITIKETKNMVVNGTTGMRTWQGALMLADFVICNKDSFRGKHILELGSGVGFTGIAIAKYCDINSITLTDCHNDVLKTIYDNLQINFPLIKIQEKGDDTIFKDEKINIHLTMLDWNYIEELPDDVVPDVLIGSDIIYDPTILKPLSTVIKTFCSKNKTLEVYIANVIRNLDTYESFLEILDSDDLCYEEVPQTKCINIDWDLSTRRCLLKIKLKSDVHP